MRFDGFYGNDGAKTLISGIFDSGRVPHAILIDGPRGAGKKTLAKIISEAAVCESQGELPCGRCRQCVNARAGVHPDVLLTQGTGTRSVSVDTVRKIRLDAYVGPNDAARKVYILSDIQDMTEQAQNALLKILEEPPAYVLFILTCDSRAHVLETVRSRSQLVSAGPVSVQDAVKALEEQVKANADEALRAARISGGIIGRAKLMLGEGFGEIDKYCESVVNALCGANIYAFIGLSGKIEKGGDMYTAFSDILPALMRDAISFRNGGEPNLSGLENQARLLSKTTAIKKLFRAEMTALEFKKAAERNVNVGLNATFLFSQLWKDIHE